AVRRGVLALVLVLGAHATHAQPKADADRAYAEGQTLYASGDYLAAAAKFERAYQLDPDPAVLFNIAQAYRLGKDCAHAGSRYRDYLSAAGVSAANRDRVAKYI